MMIDEVGLKLYDRSKEPIIKRCDECKNGKYVAHSDPYWCETWQKWVFPGISFMATHCQFYSRKCSDTPTEGEK